MQFGFNDGEGFEEFRLPNRSLVVSEATGSTFEAFVGLPKWNRSDVKHFYPKGVKEELSYYARQFNAVELNATFSRQWPAQQILKWVDSVPADFRFFPKFPKGVSHEAGLKDCEQLIDQFIESISLFGKRLGVPFLQMPESFGPEDFDLLTNFANSWPLESPVAIELRNGEWFSDADLREELFDLYRSRYILPVLIDTAGRRDLLHMTLTTPTAFIRFVGVNLPVDYDRLTAWAERIAKWKTEGLREVYFFIHEHEPKTPVELAAHFIKQLNQATGTQVRIPELLAA